MAVNDMDTDVFIGHGARDGAMLNGARAVQDDGGVIGFTIPAGVSGTDSYVKLSHAIGAAEAEWLPDITLELRAVVEISASYQQRFVVQPEYQAGPVPGWQGVRFERLDATRYLAVCRFDMPPASTVLAVTVQARDTAVIDEERHLRVRDVALAPVASRTPLLSPAQAARRLSMAWLEQRLAARLDTAGQAGTAVQVVAVADTTASLSRLVMSDAAPTRTLRRQLRLGPGRWMQSGIPGRPFVDIVGAGRDKTVIHGALPDDIDPFQIRITSTLDYAYDQSLEGVTVVARNSRYVVHADNPEAPFGLVQVFRDCTLVHEGNQGAIDHHVHRDDPDTARTLWPHTAAFGGACYNGGRLEFQRCRFHGDRLAVAIHNRAAAQAASFARLDTCSLAATAANGTGNAGRSLEVFNFGSGFNDTVEVVGCALDGDLHYFTSHWHVADLSYQPADHTEFHVVGHGNSPAVAIVEDFGRAFRIDSAATEGRSTVEVTGGAVAILFGEIVSRDGAGGFRGYAHGTFDIQDRTPVGPKVNLFITGLGKRLGDCTTTRPSLVVRIDGGDAITITFDADYTSVPNTDILAMINSALGARATASEDRVGERYRPCFSDEERTYVNGSPTGITMGSAVAYGDDGSKYVRLMTDRDEAHMFAGIAWQDIYPGELGRVKTSGYLPLTDILCDDDAALVTGVALSPGPTPGRLVASSISPVARAIRPDAVRLLRP